MSSKGKNKPYGGLQEYLQTNYKTLFELLRICDVFNVAHFSYEDSGTSFAIPSDEILEEHLHDLHTASAEGAEQICRAVRSYVIKYPIGKSDVLPGDVVDLNQQILDISKEGKVYKLTYKDTAASTTVKIEQNVPVINVVILRVESGKLFYDPSHVRTKPRGHNMRRAVSTQKTERTGEAMSRSRFGGYMPSQRQRSHLRFAIAIVVENHFAHDTLNRAAAGQVSAMTPYTACVASLAQFLYSRHPDIFYGCVLPAITFRMVDFYVLLEPHRDAEPGQFLIPDEIIAEWWGLAKEVYWSFSPEISAFRAFVDRALDEAPSKAGGSTCAIYASSESRKNIILAIENSVRPNISFEKGFATETIQRLQQAYTKLVTENKIDTIAQIYPASLIQYYQRLPLLKMAHDELGYVTEPMMAKLCAESVTYGLVESLDTFRQIISLVANVLHSNDNASIMNHAPLSSPIIASILAGSNMRELERFGNSSMFMHIPLKTDEIKDDFPLINSPDRRTPIDTAVYNADKWLILQHERLPDLRKKVNMEYLMEAIKMIGAPMESPSIAAALQ